MKHILNSDCGSEFTETYYFQSWRWGRSWTESPHSVIIVIDSFPSVLFCNINIINQTDWQSLSGGSVRVSRLPVPQSCCPRCKRLLWTRAPECVRLQQPHPGCGSLTEPAPAGAGCGSWLGLQGGQLGDLQQEGKQIRERYDKEKNNINDLNMNFILKILQLHFLLHATTF